MIGVHANGDKLLSTTETGLKILHCTITGDITWRVTQMARLDPGKGIIGQSSGGESIHHLLKVEKPPCENTPLQVKVLL